MKKLTKGLFVLSLGLMVAGCSCNNDKEPEPIENIYNVNNVYDDVSTNFEAIYNEAVQSTVTIIAKGQIGSGVVYKEEGNVAYVLTNAHVLTDASSNDYTNSNFVDIIFSNYVRVRGEKIFLDKNEDVAVVKIEKSQDYKVAKVIARDSNVSIGETVFAIGNPKGNSFSVTTGVISTNRLETTTDYISGTSSTKTFVFNTTATINPGNSGGALFNSKGEVIAINSMQPSDQTTTRNFNYAIPINHFIDVADYIVTFRETYTKPKLNLEVKSICDYSSSDIAKMGIAVKKGVYITNANEGEEISKGRIITHIEGEEIATSLDYYFKLMEYNKGQTIQLTTTDVYGNNIKTVNLIMK